MNKQTLSKLNIPIPNLTIQKQIADFCDKNDKLIKQLEEGIEEYKQLAKNIFRIYLSINKGNIEEQSKEHSEEQPEEQPDEQSNEEPKPKKKAKKDMKKKI